MYSTQQLHQQTTDALENVAKETNILLMIYPSLKLKNPNILMIG